MRAVLRRAVKLLRLVRRPAYRRGLRLGVAASLEALPALRGLAVRTVIDVGANVGQFSLLMTGLRPGVTVHAFEPFGRSAAVFERLFAGNPGVRLHRCAVGAEEAEAILHVSGRADNSSLLPIGAAQVRFAPGTAEVGTVSVPVRTLDAVLDPLTLARPILLKLDVQGGELAALRGAERLLSVVDHIYVEVSFAVFYEGQPTADAIISHLARRGFAVAGIGGIARDQTGRVVQCDLLFERGTTETACSIIGTGHGRENVL